MKNTAKHFGIIVLMTIIVLTMTACNNGTTDSDDMMLLMLLQQPQEQPRSISIEETDGRLTINVGGKTGYIYAMGHESGSGQQRIFLACRQGLVPEVLTGSTVTLEVWEIKDGGYTVANFKGTLNDVNFTFYRFETAFNYNDWINSGLHYSHVTEHGWASVNFVNGIAGPVTITWL
jgi:hypothetical protein